LRYWPSWFAAIAISTTIVVYEGLGSAQANTYFLNCNFVGGSDIFESNARLFRFDADSNVVEIFDKDGSRNWVFRPKGHPEALGDLDDTMILDMDGGNIHKVVAFSSVATVPNMIEVWLSEKPMKLRWVYVMSDETANLTFDCQSIR
jgi:hypothetical protein